MHSFDPIWDHWAGYLILRANNIQRNDTAYHFMFKEITEESKRTFKTYLQWMLNSFISVIALSLWAAFQYGMSQMISRMELTGIDAWVFLALQVFSAFSTILPIIFAIYEDTGRMWRRSVLRKDKGGDVPCPQ